MTRSVDPERVEQLEDLLQRMRERNREVPILVEGDKDREALRNLGFDGEIIKVNRGGRIFTLCEKLGRRHDEVIVLMDWDRTGGQLTRLLREGLEANTVAFDVDMRRSLARLTRKDITTVEGLDTYLVTLRRALDRGGGFP